MPGPLIIRKALWEMNVEDRERLVDLKVEIVNEVNKDIALAISSFKVWLMATVLSNVLLIGIPALFVFFTTQTQSTAAYDLAKDNKARIEEHAQLLTELDSRTSRVEDYLLVKDTSFKAGASSGRHPR